MNQARTLLSGYHRQDLVIYPTLPIVHMKTKPEAHNLLKRLKYGVISKQAIRVTMNVKGYPYHTQESVNDIN